MPKLKDLKAALATAKAAYEADKTNKKAKKAWKSAKKAVTEARAAKKEKAAKKSKKNKRKASDAEDEAPAKKKAKKSKKKKSEEETEPVTLESLQASFKKAKAAWKADKTNKALKKIKNTAKKALADFKESAMDTDTKEPETTEPETKEPETKAPETNTFDMSSLKKKKPSAPVDPDANPPNVSVFCRNLSYDIDDDAIRAFFEGYGTLTDIHWLTDRETGQFKGCGFVEFDSIENSTKAIAEKNEVECMGRQVYLSFARPRNKPRGGGGGGGGRGGGKSGRAFVEKPLSERPDNCTTAFVGNVSFDIDDEKLTEFAKDCGEIKSIRWLTDRETGDFKGCGFVDFYSPEGVDAFVKLRGQQCMGRPIRIDYSKPRPPREY